LQDQAKNASVVPSQGRSSIQCHRCQGFGRISKDCPSKRTYIATDDGGYIVVLMLRTTLMMSLLLKMAFH
jgi:hypothetical protein